MNRDARDAEFRRLKQTLANNGYPQKMVEKIIVDKMRKYMSPAPEPKNDPSFYLALQNLSKFTADTKEIRSIVRAHVRSCLSDKEVEVTTFFRPTKLSTRFSTRSRLSDAERSGVVYSFSCPETSCSAVYTGHTTQALKNRISQHRRVESSICKHFHNDHDKPVPNLDSFSNCFK